MVYRFLILAFLSLAHMDAQTIFLQEEFSAGTLPGGWTRTSVGSPSAGWEFGTSLQSTGFPIPSHGSYAACNDNLHDNALGTANDAFDDQLRTPVLNLSSATSVVVEFDYYNVADASGTGSFIVSTNGGASFSFTFILSEVGVWEHFRWELFSWSSNTMIGFRYQDGGTSAYGLAIDNLVVYQPDSTQAGLIRPYTSGQMPMTGGYIGGQIRNYGLNDITDFSLSYSIDGGAPVSGSLSGYHFQLGQDSTFRHPVPVSFPSAGWHSIRCWLTDVNGLGPDANPTNDTITWDVEVLPVMPQKRVLVEDITGAWCVFCADGSLRHQQALAAFPDAIGMAIHYGDQMDSGYIAYSGTELSLMAASFPSAVVDRFPLELTYPSLTGFPSQFQEMIAERELMYRPVGVSVTGVSWNSISRTVTATVQVTFYDTLSGDLRMNLYMVADSLYGSGTGWDQANSANGFPGHPYFGLGDPIPGYVHKHVYMTGGGGAWGTPGIIPGTVYPGDVFSYTYSLQVPHLFWESVNQADSITPDLITLVGVAQCYDTAQISRREILNAASVSLSSVTGVRSEIRFPGIQVFPNPTPGQCQVVLPPGSVPTGVVVTDLAGKVCLIDWEETGAGVYRLNMNGLPAGTYLLMVETSSGNYRERLVLY